ncbi:RNase P subunit [Schizosaccharomyces japonicus yFS275]|uniref:RNase P subunit n=1 Tax=Schizosaccharomyces japonicus (strain yFS275 / FY16936) TaxID=402676 RepID=B6JX28_SCHJY|nr:RNase P subunit [Schizosaccharomyces japonicus yFS275]EEB05929.1 RNase P subunit [Schizosaccharomyces japonicus yFS275]
MATTKCSFSVDTYPGTVEKSSYYESQSLLHPFNKKFHVIVPSSPDCEFIYSQFETVIQNHKTLYFSANASCLLSSSLYESFVQNGTITLLSDSLPDSSSSIALYNGTIWISMDKDTYLCAGLSAKASGNQPKNTRWDALFNISDTPFKYGSKNFERLRKGLERLPDFNFIATCPSDKIQDFLEAAPFTVRCEPIRLEHNTLRSQKIPPVLFEPNFPYKNNDDDDLSTLKENAFDILEYMSLLGLHSPLLQSTNATDPYVSTYTIPMKNAGEPQTGDITQITVSGLLTPDICLCLYSRIQSPEWFFTGLVGYPCTPVSWIGKVHVHNYSGENAIYTLSRAKQNSVRWTWKLFQ